MHQEYKYPDFQRLITREINGNRVMTSEEDAQFLLERKIEISLVNKVDQKENPNKIIIVTLDFLGKLNNIYDSDEVYFYLNVKYNVIFDFLDDTLESNLIVEQLKNSDYQYTIIAQAYSVSIENYLKLINDFGINSSRINHRLNLIKDDSIKKEKNKPSHKKIVATTNKGRNKKKISNT